MPKQYEYKNIIIVVVIAVIIYFIYNNNMKESFDASSFHLIDQALPFYVNTSDNTCPPKYQYADKTEIHGKTTCDKFNAAAYYKLNNNYYVHNNKCDKPSYYNITPTDGPKGAICITSNNATPKVCPNNKCLCSANLSGSNPQCVGRRASSTRCLCTHDFQYPVLS